MTLSENLLILTRLQPGETQALLNSNRFNGFVESTKSGHPAEAG